MAANNKGSGNSSSKAFKIGRDAETGRLTTVEYARAHPKTTSRTYAEAGSRRRRSKEVGIAAWWPGKARFFPNHDSFPGRQHPHASPAPPHPADHDRRRPRRGRARSQHPMPALPDDLFRAGLQPAPPAAGRDSAGGLGAAPRLPALLAARTQGPMPGLDPGTASLRSGTPPMARAGRRQDAGLSRQRRADPLKREKRRPPKEPAPSFASVDLKRRSSRRAGSQNQYTAIGTS